MGRPAKGCSCGRLALPEVKARLSHLAQSDSARYSATTPSGPLGHLGLVGVAPVHGDGTCALGQPEYHHAHGRFMYAG